MRKLLIIDDEETLTNSLKSFLDVAGYKVETAKNSDEAFKLIEEFKPELLLLDLHLPESLSGLQILRIVRKTKPKLKVIIMTGFGDQIKVEEECFRLGIVKFLYKPLRVKELKEELDKVA